MKLRYHSIVGGRYYKAGEEVPDAPPSLAKYAVSEDGDAADLQPVKRKYAVARPGRMYPGAKSKRVKA